MIPELPFESQPKEKFTQRSSFKNLSLNTKVVLIATLLSLLTYSVLYAYHYLGGGFLYYYEYLAAVVWHTEPSPACFRIKVAKDLKDSVDWFQMQRCLGNDLGLTRRGDSWRVLREIIQQLFAPTTAPGFVVAS